jgi:hypothetical protein
MMALAYVLIGFIAASLLAWLLLVLSDGKEGPE